MTRNEERKSIRKLLVRWGSSTEKIARLRRELADVWERVESTMDLHTSAMSGMPRSGKRSDRTATAAEKHAREMEWNREEIERLEEEIEAEQVFSRAMSRAIESIDVQLADIVKLRYRGIPIAGKPKSPKTVARMTGYSESNVEKLDANAVDELAKMIKTEIVLNP